MSIIATFHLRGGQSIDIECENVETTAEGNVLKRYSINDITGTHTLYLRIDAIDAITYREKPTAGFQPRPITFISGPEQ